MLGACTNSTALIVGFLANFLQSEGTAGQVLVTEVPTMVMFVTRALLRSERIVHWPRWVLDIEKAPFRSIGAVAAALAFIASVAIILVSAEVSRISAVA